MWCVLIGNHYAAQHIRTVASRLDRTWKEFAAGLDERTSVLGLSVLFHHKAEQYCDSVSSWAAACEATQPLPSEIQGLETAIRTHQSLYEAMCQAYTEVSNPFHDCFFFFFFRVVHELRRASNENLVSLID